MKIPFLADFGHDLEPHLHTSDIGSSVAMTFFSIFERSKQVFVSDGLQFRVRLIVNSTPSKLDR